MSTLIFQFLVVFGVIFLNALLGKAVAALFVSSDKTSVAGFSYAIGATSAFSSFSADDLMTKISTAVAMVLGLAGAWYFFFKREKAHG